MGRTPNCKSRSTLSPGSYCHRLKINDLLNLNVTSYPLSLSTEMIMVMNNETSLIQNKLKSLRSGLRDVYTKYESTEALLSKIHHVHSQIQEEGGFSSSKSVLRGLYSEAREDTDAEIKILLNSLSTINDIRYIRNEVRLQAKHSGNKETVRRGALMKMLHNTAQTLPLWVGVEDEDPPPLSGAIPADASYQARTGDMVAALVHGAEEEDTWILAEVLSYNSSSGRYEVEDIDEEQRERLTLSRRRVVPLPTRRIDPETHPHALFPEGSVVNAIYPQTTCFYKGVVKCPPISAVDDYEILFEDSSYSDGFAPPLRVAQRYVIAYREKKSKKE